MTPELRYAVPHTRRMAPIARQARAMSVAVRVAAAKPIQPLRAAKVDAASQSVPSLPPRKLAPQGGRKPSRYNSTKMTTRKRNASAAAFIGGARGPLPLGGIQNVTVMVSYAGDRFKAH